MVYLIKDGQIVTQNNVPIWLPDGVTAPIENCCCGETAGTKCTSTPLRGPWKVVSVSYSTMCRWVGEQCWPVVINRIEPYGSYPGLEVFQRTALSGDAIEPITDERLTALGYEGLSCGGCRLIPYLSWSSFSSATGSPGEIILALVDGYIQNEGIFDGKDTLTAHGNWRPCCGPGCVGCEEFAGCICPNSEVGKANAGPYYGTTAFATLGDISSCFSSEVYEGLDPRAGTPLYREFNFPADQEEGIYAGKLPLVDADCLGEVRVLSGANPYVIVNWGIGDVASDAGVGGNASCSTDPGNQFWHYSSSGCRNTPRLFRIPAQGPSDRYMDYMSPYDLIISFRLEPAL